MQMIRPLLYGREMFYFISECDTETLLSLSPTKEMILPQVSPGLIVAGRCLQRLSKVLRNRVRWKKQPDLRSTLMGWLRTGYPLLIRLLGCPNLLYFM